MTQAQAEKLGYRMICCEETRDDLEALLALHRQEKGEATPDQRRYCSTCRKPDGSAALWPCKTVRIIRRILEMERAHR